MSWLLCVSVGSIPVESQTVQLHSDGLAWMYMESDQQWRSLGRHRYRIEGDLLFSVANGDIGAEEIILLCEQLLLIYNQYGYVYEIVDATNGGAMSAEARRRNADWHRQHAIQGDAVVFGANILLRTVFTLLTNALRLLTHSNLQIQFVATESDARSLVTAHRQRRSAQRT